MRTNIYIRDADESLWKTIPNKSEWISAKLNETPTEKVRRQNDNFEIRNKEISDAWNDRQVTSFKKEDE